MNSFKITMTSGRDYIFSMEQTEEELRIDIDIKNNIKITENITVFTRHIESLRVM